MRHVAQNAAWNVGGQLASLAVGLVALPVLLHSLGAARMGIFTLALGLIGFSGLMDLGLGRALTQAVAGSIGEGHSRDGVAALVTRITRLLVFTGIGWGLLLWWSTPWIVRDLLDLKGNLASEAAFGLRSLALSIPFALAATLAMAALEGLQSFRLLSAWRVPLSILQFGLPALVSLWRQDVGWAIAALAVTRVLAMLVWRTLLHRLLPDSGRTKADDKVFRHALRFGGWLSVSNLVGPLMVYADRFYLASAFPPATVAYYTLPFDAALRLTVLPQTAVNAIFPALADARGRSAESAIMVGAALNALVVLVFPPLIAVATLAYPILAWWLDPSFATHAAPVLRWLLVGVSVNSLAHVPYALLQANGRADVTAKLHVLELPLFAAMLVVMVREIGILGAAAAWTIRVALDCALLFAAAWQLLPDIRSTIARGGSRVLFAVMLMTAVVFVLKGAAQLITVAVILTFGLIETGRMLRAFAKVPASEDRH